MSQKYTDPRDEYAHQSAQSHPPKTQYSLGQTVQLVIHKSATDNNGYEAVARLDGIYCFVQDEPQRLSAGDRIQARISELGDTYLKAVPLLIID